MGCRRGCWRKFAIGPNGAVFEVLLFPDGDGALKGVNGEAAGVKSGAAMGRADGDEHAGFADFETAEAMDDSDAVNGEFFVQQGGDFSHFGKRHRFVSLVVEIKSGAIVGLIADEAIKRDDSAVFGSADVSGEGRHVDGIADQLADVIVRGRGHGGVRLAAAHGRKEGDFVSGMKRRVPGRKFLVAGGDERRPVLCKLGIADGIESEELLDGGGVSGVDRIFGAADEVLKAAEEEDFEASGLGDRGHRGIVTRAQGCG